MSTNTVDPDFKIEPHSDSTSKWLDNEFFEEHLRNYYKNDEIKVISFNRNSATGKGERFLSSVYRVNVLFSETSEKYSSRKTDISSISLIVKEEAQDEWALQVSQDFEFFNKEIEFYSEVTPKINQKLKELGEPALFPDLIGVCKSRNIIILEDLSVDGYRVFPVKDGYNFEESKAILKRIATFHAICAVLQEEKPDIFVNFKNGRLSRKVGPFRNWHAFTIDAIIETISDWPDFATYAEKLRHLRDKIFERSQRTFDLNPNHFNTLVHDDLWTTNFLIKTKDGPQETPFENVMLIDFQFIFRGSPTIDLHHFLNTSPNDACRPDRFDELAQFYYAQLIYYLRKLDYKQNVPTWPEFQTQYNERRIYGFILACLVWPFQNNNMEETSLENITTDNEIGSKGRLGLFKGDRARENLRKLIPYDDRLGTFD